MKRIMLSFTAVAATLALLSPVWTAAQDVTVPEKTDGQHTVVKGDTLWDISGRYLKDPFLWPEIWKVNPEIANPHLIYPGDLVALPGFKGKPAAPVDGAAAAPETPEVPGDKKAVAVGKISPRKGDSPFEDAPLVDISKTLLLIPEKKEKKVISLDETGKPKIPVATEGAILEAGFITDRLGSAMSIAGSTMGTRDIYSLEDDLLITPGLEDVEPGSLLVTLQDEGQVLHPATGMEVGSLVKVTGVLRMERTSDDYLLCKVIKTINDIRPSNFVLPYVEPELVYDPVPRNPELRGEWGYVIIGQDLKQLSAQTYPVYLDLGSYDGVKPGDSFIVRRSGGLAHTGDAILPDVVVGEVQVISVEDRTSTAKVLSFDEPVRPGYRIYYKD